MENLFVEKSEKTPEVLLEGSKGLIVIKGRSLPEDPIGFYKPIIEWVHEYCHAPSKRTEVNVHLEFFNTSSSKCILDIFRCLELAYKKGSDVAVNWICDEDDEDLLECGEDYRSIINLPINIIEIS